MDSGTDVRVPSGLLEQIQAMADADHRPAGEIVRDALEAYLQTRRSAQAFAEARALGLPDSDESMTSAYRQVVREKIAQGVRSLREGKGVDGEEFFAQMEKEFEAFERQGH